MIFSFNSIVLYLDRSVLIVLLDASYLNFVLRNKRRDAL
jgi:hypothetical protein